MESYDAKPGDVFHLVGSGGGGCGDPFEREPDLVLDDVREGKVTPTAARHDYGVVLTHDLRVDEAATAALRQPMPLRSAS